MAGLRPQQTVLLALFALVPVGLYAVTAGVTPLVALAGLNVILIAASLYLLFGPVPAESGDAPGGDPAS